VAGDGTLSKFCEFQLITPAGQSRKALTEGRVRRKQLPRIPDIRHCFRKRRRADDDVWIL